MLQRGVLVVGLLALLWVTVVHPPLRALMDGQWIDARQFCAQTDAGDGRCWQVLDYQQDTGRLLVYVAVIVVVTLVGVVASKRRA